MINRLCRVSSAKASDAEHSGLNWAKCRTYVQRAEVLVHPHVLEPLLRARAQLSTPCRGVRRRDVRGTQGDSTFRLKPFPLKAVPSYGTLCCAGGIYRQERSDASWAARTGLDEGAARTNVAARRATLQQCAWTGEGGPAPYRKWRRFGSAARSR